MHMEQQKGMHEGLQGGLQGSRQESLQGGLQDSRQGGLQDIKAVVFDLDGTLYQDHDFYKGYIEMLLDGSPWARSTERIIAIADAILSGRAAQKMGWFFDRGTAKPISSIDDLQEIRLHENSEPNFSPHFYSDSYAFVGDAWSVVMILSPLLDIAPEKRRAAFLGTRQRMLEQNTLIRCAGLRSALERLAGQGGADLYLYTNTPQEGAVGFVEALGLSGLIPDANIEYGIKKPYGLQSRLPGIIERAGGAGHVLSVGDHSFNDLSPAKAAGAKTALVSLYTIYDNIDWDYRIQTLEQLGGLLEEIMRMGVAV